jgi:small-conductance mechanosensitive channel
MTREVADNMIDADTIHQWAEAARAWLIDEVLVFASMVQLGVVAAALLVSMPLASRLRRAVAGLRERFELKDWMDQTIKEVEALALPLVWLTIQWLIFLIASGSGWERELLEIAVSLLTAWIVIRVASTLIRNRACANAFAIVAWSIAALSIVDLLEPVIALLDSAAVRLGGLRLSLLGLINGAILLTVLLWLAFAVSRAVERRAGSSTILTPSARVLVSQFTKITLVTVAIVFSLSSMGIDLTAFAVFTGALGVGIGFGLRTVVSNLLSGILLLMDRSIKPGDVIAVGATFGTVNFMGARYLSLLTRDGIEHLIPNESLVTTAVENWSYSNNLVRVKTEIGVSYNSDIRKAIDLVLEAAGEAERVLKDPEPRCFIAGFGDSSVNLNLRMWINDPSNGVANVRGAVLLGVWDKFHAHGIEIPFPQRDLHIRSSEGLAFPEKPTPKD